MKTITFLLSMFCFTQAFALDGFRMLTCDGIWTIESSDGKFMIRQPGQRGDMYPEEQYKLSQTLTMTTVRDVHCQAMTAFNSKKQKISICCPRFNLTAPAARYDDVCYVSYNDARASKLNCSDI